MSTRFKEACDRGRHQWGDKFVPPIVTRVQADYFQSKSRVEVTSPSGYVRRGYISITTGYQPVLLLMHRYNSQGSSDTLTHTDAITAWIDRGSSKRYAIKDPFTQFLEIVT